MCTGETCILAHVYRLDMYTSTCIHVLHVHVYMCYMQIWATCILAHVYMSVCYMRIWATCILLINKCSAIHNGALGYAEHLFNSIWWPPNQSPHQIHNLPWVTTDLLSLPWTETKETENWEKAHTWKFSVPTHFHILRIHRWCLLFWCFLWK